MLDPRHLGQRNAGNSFQCLLVSSSGLTTIPLHVVNLTGYASFSYRIKIRRTAHLPHRLTLVQCHHNNRLPAHVPSLHVIILLRPVGCVMWNQDHICTTTSESQYCPHMIYSHDHHDRTPLVSGWVAIMGASHPTRSWFRMAVPRPQQWDILSGRNLQRHEHERFELLNAGMKVAQTTKSTGTKIFMTRTFCLRWHE